MNRSSLKIRDASGWTMFVFGVLAILFGLIGLISPETLLVLLGFEIIERAQRAAGDYTLVFTAASSMASFNIGIYYVLAAFHNLKNFYLWTVPFRAVTFTVFTVLVVKGFAPARFLGVGIWELVGGVATGLALFFERNKSDRS